MMTSLVMLLTGPLQSWGVRSAFNKRETAPYPTRSALLGLLASAHGIHRHDPLPPTWEELGLVVRRDRRGRLLTDFHTVGADRPPDQQMITAEGKRRANPVITERAYLADAAFLAVLSGPPTVIDGLAQALRRPHWPPYLGRRSCPPALPILVGTSRRDPMELARRLPLYRNKPHRQNQVEVTALTDLLEEASADFSINDVPRGRVPDRRSFAARGVIEIPMDRDAQACAGTGIQAYRKLVTSLEEDR